MTASNNLATDFADTRDAERLGSRRARGVSSAIANCVAALDLIIATGAARSPIAARHDPGGTAVSTSL